MFTDSTGAEYRLDNCTTAVCTSRELHIAFERDTKKLRFNDGTWWLMDVESAQYEQDAGTLYPSLIQDTNGNQIQLRYRPGTYAGYPESSSKLDKIMDARQTHTQSSSGVNLSPTWNFVYSQVNGQMYLTNIVGRGGTFTFGYSGPFTLTPPWFSTENYGTVMYLSTVSRTDSGMHQFYYNGSTGEVSSAVLPYGAQIVWNLRDYTYQGNRTLREIQTRLLTVPGSLPAGEPAMSPMTSTHTFGRNDAAYPTQYVHVSVAIIGAQNQKFYWFDETGQIAALWERNNDGTSKRATEYVWDVHPVSQIPYLASVTMSMGDVQLSWSEQDVDEYGNVVASRKKEPGTSRTRTTSFSYLHNQPGKSAYASSAYIRNRLTSATVSDNFGGGSFTPFTAQYDTATILSDPGPPPPGSVEYPEQLALHDTATYTPSFTMRGNATNVCKGGACTVVGTIDKLGMVRHSTGPNGVFDAIPTTNYWRYGTVPSAVTLNGVQTSLVYDGAMRLSTATSPEGTSTFGWDSMERPTSKRGPDGSEVKITYGFSPAMTKEVSGNRWTETYLDGLGRPVRVMSGYGGVDLTRPGRPAGPSSTASVVESMVDTRYAECACSPFGKPYMVSRPRTSASQPLVWTVTTYDDLGRPASVTHAPVSGTAGNSGVTYYWYPVQASPPAQWSGVTDPAGRWKSSAVNAFGDMVEVGEPAPAGGYFMTQYQYTALGQIKTMTMLRPGATGAWLTQTRTWVYNSDGTVQSTDYPETGLIRYVYANGKVVKKIDDQNRATKWEYDATTQRLMYVKRLGATGNPMAQDGPENTALRIAYTYDSAGRVSQIVTGPGGQTVGGFTETFTYTGSGQLQTKQLQTPWATLSSSWTYDLAGRMASVTYPSGAKKLVVYDNAGRNVTLGDQAALEQQSTNSWTDPVTGGTVWWTTTTARAEFDGMGRMTRMYGPTAPFVAGDPAQWTQAWSFNEGGLMTGYELVQGYSPSSNTRTAVGYQYGSVAAAGKLETQTWGQYVNSSSTAAASSSTSYQYDSLGRLTSASTPGWWTQDFVYDGFGNLVQKIGTGQALGASADWRSGFNSAQNGGRVVDSEFVKYDQEYRLIQHGVETYAYDASNRRVIRKRSEWVNQWEVTFWTGGRRMGTYRLGWDDNFQRWGVLSVSDEYSIAGRYVKPQDRLGSNLADGRRYLPYGEELSSTVNDVDKFATYRRDATGLDYADQRYYVPGAGRFMTADRGPVEPRNPQSWNRYTYTWGDPVNFNDPDGMMPAALEGWVCDPLTMSAEQMGLCLASAAGGSVTSRLETVRKIFEPLAPFIADWDYANSNGTAFNIELDASTLSLVDLKEIEEITKAVPQLRAGRVLVG